MSVKFDDLKSVNPSMLMGGIFPGRKGHQSMLWAPSTSLLFLLRIRVFLENDEGIEA